MILFVAQRIVRLGRHMPRATPLGIDAQGLPDGELDTAAIADRLQAVRRQVYAGKVQAVRRSQTTPVAVVAEIAVSDR